MNRRMVLYIVGQMIKLESLLMVLPLFVALYYRENCTLSILISATVSLFAGFLLTLISKPGNKVIYAKDGFAIVGLSWITLSVFGALPFTVSGEIPNFFDAFFETVSGFTTTGATILTEVEHISRSLLFWRSFTHWVGGMGVLVFITAIIPSASERSMHILKAEMPGPIIGKLVPKTKDTAKILYIIYISMTFLEIILLLFGGMPLFDSIVHSFGTAGTGGFGIKNDSIASYSPYLQWVITVFMFLFSINFNLYYLIIIKKINQAVKSTELWVFTAINAVAVGIITFDIYKLYNNLSDSIRNSAFQVASIISTTGYSTADFNKWPDLSKAVLLLLMLCGACAGSTGGGFKVSRLIIIAKLIAKEFKHMLHPRAVHSIKFEGKTLDKQTVNGVSSYLAVYVLALIVPFLILSFEPFGLETNLSAVIACFNNIGPGLGAVGPAGNFSQYSDLSKFVLSASMLLGRLEIYPLVIALSPTTWKRN